MDDEVMQGDVIHRNRSMVRRVSAWTGLIVSHLTAIVGGVVFAIAAMNRAVVPGGFKFFALFACAILYQLWIYFTIGAKGYRYSPLGPALPRPIPFTAWRGEIIDWDGGRVGRLRGAGRWIVSREGLLFTCGFVTIFVRWQEVISIRPTNRSGRWNIEHKADDVRSPLESGEGVVNAITRLRGALPTT